MCKERKKILILQVKKETTICTGEKTQWIILKRIRCEEIHAYSIYTMAAAAAAGEEHTVCCLPV